MDKDINKIVEMYIKNIYEYEKDFDEDTIFDKQKELEQIAETDTVDAASHLRPYTNVIQQMIITNSNYDIKEIRTGLYEVNFKVRTLTHTYDGKKAESEHTEQIKVERTLKSSYFISSLSSDIQQIYATYMDYGDLQPELRKSEQAYYEYMIGNVNLENIYYMYKGYPFQNPLVNDDKQLPCDSYNFIYWLYYNVDVELEYPLRSVDVLTGENFNTILEKCHKYKDDISKINEGDLIFFGINDDNVGIYMGDGEVATIIGYFPIDESGRVRTYKLEELWEAFNGRVMRYKDPIFDFYVEGK